MSNSNNGPTAAMEADSASGDNFWWVYVVTSVGFCPRADPGGFPVVAALESRHRYRCRRRTFGLMAVSRRQWSFVLAASAVCGDGRRRSRWISTIGGDGFTARGLDLNGGDSARSWRLLAFAAIILWRRQLHSGAVMARRRWQKRRIGIRAALGCRQRQRRWRTPLGARSFTTDQPRRRRCTVLAASSRLPANLAASISGCEMRTILACQGEIHGFF